MIATMRTYFGFESVGSSEKSQRIQAVFEGVAPHYDFMNDVMSLGLHRLWKREMVQALSPKPFFCLVDVGGGTGDIALRVKKTYNFLSPSLVVVDPSPGMLQVGKDKAIDSNVWDIQWVEGAAEALPLPSSSSDICTMAFGLRNVTCLGQTFKEILRVLKPGGQFVCLEFSKPDEGVENLHRIYTLDILPALGKWLASNEAGYRYLGESIQTFLNTEQLEAALKEAGFVSTSFRKMAHGIVALHQAWKRSE